MGFKTMVEDRQANKAPRINNGLNGVILKTVPHEIVGCLYSLMMSAVPNHNSLTLVWDI